MRELRLHGRGGQGTVIASKLLAVALFLEGREVQSFPMFGVERRGSPVTAFLRVDDAPIKLRCEIQEPDELIVLDPTLIGATDITAGLKPGGRILINTDQAPEDFPQLLERFHVSTIDAAGVAIRHGLGGKSQPIVNTAILGAFAADSGTITMANVCNAIREEVPMQLEANIAAAAEAATAVRHAAMRDAHLTEAARVPETITTTDGARAIPEVAMSTTSTLVTRTGSWKYKRPAYHDRVAPCNAGCPVGIDIEGYLNLLREGRVDEARDLLLAENPLPAVTGRVCHHPCENTCNRRSLDGAVAIHAVERAMGDLARQRPAPVLTGERRTERVAVVGSGPAGLACAYHLARFGYAVTIYESAEEAGGMLRLGIPEYRLPREVLDGDIARVVAHGVEIKCGVRIGEHVTWKELTELFNAVCIATGAHTSRALGVPGEQLPGVQPGLVFLRDVNGGKRPDLGRHVVVVGGGNTAMDCARSAMRLGAKVTVAYRRTREQMPAIKEEVDDAMREGAEFVFLANPVEFKEADGRVCALVAERMALGEPDASGRRRPVPTGGHFTIEADTVLTAIGESSVLEGFFPDVEGSDSGLQVDALGGTNRDMLYAGGDVTDLARTVADALGAGKRAAIGIDRHLRRHHGDTAELNALRFADGNLSAARWMGHDPIRRVDPINAVVGVDDVNFAQYQRVPRHADPHLDSDRAHGGFDEVNAGLSTAEALDEAKRCLNCGVCTQCDVCLIFCPDAAITRAEDGSYTIALDYCKGCGICAAECPRGAITMTQDRP